MQQSVIDAPVVSHAEKHTLRRMSPLWPLFAACATLLGCIAHLFQASAYLTGGSIVYSLDDPYIHMAMARSFAEHGVWGITPHGFTSSTSSPIWTLIIAVAFRFFGVHDWIPLA